MKNEIPQIKDTDLQELELILELIKKNELHYGEIPLYSICKQNLYLNILFVLKEKKWGIKYKQIKKELKKIENKEIKNIVYQLKKLKERNLIEKDGEKWKLSNKGKMICTYLFE